MMRRKIWSFKYIFEVVSYLLLDVGEVVPLSADSKFYRCKSCILGYTSVVAAVEKISDPTALGFSNKFSKSSLETLLNFANLFRND